MDDKTKTTVDELVVLSKFEGDPLPENEFERISIRNGVVISHVSIDSCEQVGPVENNNLTGAEIGTLILEDKEVK